MRSCLVRTSLLRVGCKMGHDDGIAALIRWSGIVRNNGDSWTELLPRGLSRALSVEGIVERQSNTPHTISRPSQRTKTSLASDRKRDELFPKSGDDPQEEQPDPEDSTTYQRAGVQRRFVRGYLPPIIMHDEPSIKPADFSYIGSGVRGGSESVERMRGGREELLQRVLTLQEMHVVAERITAEATLKLGNVVDPESYDRFARKITMEHDGPVWLQFYLAVSALRTPNINITFRNRLSYN